jgi:hypothetical protein
MKRLSKINEFLAFVDVSPLVLFLVLCLSAKYSNLRVMEWKCDMVFILTLQEFLLLWQFSKISNL